MNRRATYLFVYKVEDLSSLHKELNKIEMNNDEIKIYKYTIRSIEPENLIYALHNIDIEKKAKYVIDIAKNITNEQKIDIERAFYNNNEKIYCCRLTKYDKKKSISSE